MQSQIILAAIVAVPLLLALIFRVGTVLVFLSFIVGDILQRTLGETTALTLSSFIKSGPVDQIANLGLLALPFVLTLFFSRKTLSRGGIVLQLFPLIISCLALGFLALPLLTAGVRGALYGGPFGGPLQQVGDLVVAIAAILNLMVAWRLYRYQDKHDKK